METCNKYRYDPIKKSFSFNIYNSEIINNLTFSLHFHSFIKNETVGTNLSKTYVAQKADHRGARFGDDQEADVRVWEIRKYD